MNATLTVDRTKYVRLANRIVVKAIETEAALRFGDGRVCFAPSGVRPNGCGSGAADGQRPEQFVP